MVLSSTGLLVEEVSFYRVLDNMVMIKNTLRKLHCDKLNGYPDIGQAYSGKPAVLWVLCLESRTSLEQTGCHVTSPVSTL